jgi:hypothetical protein
MLAAERVEEMTPRMRWPDAQVGHAKPSLAAHPSAHATSLLRSGQRVQVNGGHDFVTSGGWV